MDECVLIRKIMTAMDSKIAMTKIANVIRDYVDIVRDTQKQVANVLMAETMTTMVTRTVMIQDVSVFIIASIREARRRVACVLMVETMITTEMLTAKSMIIVKHNCAPRTIRHGQRGPNETV